MSGVCKSKVYASEESESPFERAAVDTWIGRSSPSFEMQLLNLKDSKCFHKFFHLRRFKLGRRSNTI